MQSGVVSASTSLAELASNRLERLGRALGLAATELQDARALFGLMTRSWGQTPVGLEPPWGSDISDDGTPFEFSLEFGATGQARLRMLVEPRVGEPGLAAWEEGVTLTERLAVAGHADVECFNAVQSLFKPPSWAKPRFSLWHAAVMEPGGRAMVKAYFNPAVRGLERADDLVENALARLGRHEAWGVLCKHRHQVGRATRIHYFSTDLVPRLQARVKVYVGCGDAYDLFRLVEGAKNCTGQQASELVKGLAGRSGPFTDRPVLACFSFSAAGGLPEVTLHVPIRHHVPDDQVAVERVSQLLSAANAELLERALRTSGRQLTDGRGLLSYASVRPGPQGTRVTIYVAPEVYEVTPSQRRATAG